MRTNVTDRSGMDEDRVRETCPNCGQPSASPPAEVYCVECATKGWEQDALDHQLVREQWRA